MSSKVIKYRAPRLNNFPVKWTRDYTMNMGLIYPCMCEYMMPNSFWKFKAIHKLRTQPLVAPLMHDIFCFTRYFKIPLRLLMKEEQYNSYMTGGKNDDDVTPTPTVNSGNDGYSAGSLEDYLGYATNYAFDAVGENYVLSNFTQNAWAKRAYWQVINDWFINTNITDPIEFSKEPGLDTTTPSYLYPAPWGFDQYVNALPELSRGDPVYLPLGVEAPVVGNGNAVGLSNGNYLHGHIDGFESGLQPYSSNDIPKANITGGTIQPSNTFLGITTDPSKSGLVADLNDASAIDVNELRNTLALGFAKNLSAYIGTRFQDWLYGVFGARVSDARLQRAEYLGGSVTPLYISDVDQTSATVQDETPQGNLAGKGIVISSDKYIKAYAGEPCILLGVMYLLPKASYFQGTRKWMNYNSRYDYPNPLYAKISDQKILEKEIFAQSDNASIPVTVTNEEGNEVTIDVSNDTTFGFEPRFYEAQSIPSTVHGEMKTSLKHWTLAREFSKNSPPMLNDDFVYASQVSKRMFAVTSQDTDGFIGHSLFRGVIRQPLPKNSLPSSMGLLYGGD